MQWRSLMMLFRIPPFQFKALQKCMSCSQPLLNYPFKQAFSYTHVRCREREREKKIFTWRLFLWNTFPCIDFPYIVIRYTISSNSRHSCCDKQTQLCQDDRPGVGDMPIASKTKQNHGLRYAMQRNDRKSGVERQLLLKFKSSPGRCGATGRGKRGRVG